MKRVTIHIPDDKYQYVVELLARLEFVKIDKPEEPTVITDEQKALVNEEIRKMKENPGYGLKWDAVKHKVKMD